MNSRFTIGALLLAVAGACSSGDPERIGIAQQALGATYVEGQQTVSVGGSSEAVSAWVGHGKNDDCPAGAGQGAGCWVTGYNTTGNSIAGFSKARNTPKFTPPTFTACNFVSNTIPPFKGCGPGTTSVPTFKSLNGQKDQITGGFGWAGDPYVVTTRRFDGFVGYVQLGTSVGSSLKGDMVVVSLSFDAGTSFVSTDWVNAPAQSGCQDGAQDQPTAFIDTSGNGPPRLVVVWRHRGANPGIYGGCFRSGHIILPGNNMPGKIAWMGGAKNIDNMHHPAFHGIGGVMINGAFPRYTVVYMDTDDLFGWNGGNPFCKPGTPGVTQGVDFYSVSTDNFGLSWDDSVLIAHTDAWTSCLAGGNVAYGQRSFGYTREVGGNQYVALNRSQSTVEVWQSTDGAHTWGSGPLHSFGSTATNASAFHMSLDSDGKNRIALQMYMTDPGDGVITPFFVGARNAPKDDWDNFGVPVQTGYSFCVPPAPLGPFPGTISATRALGDYMEMGARDRQSELMLTYLPTWTTWPRTTCTPPNGRFVAATRVSID